jgi:hypothetical protein
MNVTVFWRSKDQRGVTFSNSEAKRAKISETVKEIKFRYFLLRDNEIDMELPIVMKTDKIGVMFMAQNALTGGYTLYVDT